MTVIKWGYIEYEYKMSIESIVEIVWGMASRGV